MLGFSCSWQTLLFLSKFQRIKRNIFGYRGGSLSVTHPFLNQSQRSMFSEIELCCLLGLTPIICRILFQVINLYKLFLILIAVLFIYHQILFVLILINKIRFFISLISWIENRSGKQDPRNWCIKQNCCVAIWKDSPQFLNL